MTIAISGANGFIERCVCVELKRLVHLLYLAWLVVQALETSVTICCQFNISGSSQLTYNDVVRLTAKALGRRVQRIHIPGRPIVPALRVSELLGIILPVKAQQVVRLNEFKALFHDEVRMPLDTTQWYLIKGLGKRLSCCVPVEIG